MLDTLVAATGLVALMVTVAVVWVEVSAARAPEPTQPATRTNAAAEAPAQRDLAA